MISTTSGWNFTIPHNSDKVDSFDSWFKATVFAPCNLQIQKWRFLRHHWPPKISDVSHDMAVKKAKVLGKYSYSYFSWRNIYTPVTIIQSFMSRPRLKWTGRHSLTQLDTNGMKTRFEQRPDSTVSRGFQHLHIGFWHQKKSVVLRPKSSRIFFTTPILNIRHTWQGDLNSIEQNRTKMEALSRPSPESQDRRRWENGVWSVRPINSTRISGGVSPLPRASIKLYPHVCSRLGVPRKFQHCEMILHHSNCLSRWPMFNVSPFISKRRSWTKRLCFYHCVLISSQSVFFAMITGVTNPGVRCYGVPCAIYITTHPMKRTLMSNPDSSTLN